MNRYDDNDDDDDDVCSIFTCSIEAHPYGVLPGGNRFFLTGDSDDGAVSSSTSASASASICSSLDDELWQDILSFCDGPTLSRVVQTCRRWYVMGHTPELWRDLVLRLQRDLAELGLSWKDTYIKIMMMQTNNNSSRSDQTAASAQPHRPIPMAGVYSDYLFRSHMCRSFSIPPHWLQPKPVDNQAQPSLSSSTGVARVKNLSTEDFLQHYEQRNRPVVLVGAAKSWPATQKWSDPSYFDKLLQEQEQQQRHERHQQGHESISPTTFRATSGAAPLSAQFTLPAYLEYAQWDYLEEAPLYLFDRSALVPQPPQDNNDDTHVDSLVATLQDDYLPSLRETLPFWDTTKCADNGGHDLFQYLGEGKRPDHTWLIVGPRRSGSVFHIDPNATHAWNANIVGRKRWIFYPPGVPPPGVYPSDDGDQVTLPLSIGEWLINFYDTEHKAAINARDRDSTQVLRPCECTVEAGDVVFVPHGWWHMVVNVDDLNVAITHNYVSRSNLPNMLRFLRTQPDQISGCRDRPESIKPEQLYDAFCNALQLHHPDWLREAQAVPDWTCLAWKTISAATPTTTPTTTTTTTTTFRRRKRKTVTGESVEQNHKQNKNYGLPHNTSIPQGESAPSFPVVEQNGCKKHAATVTDRRNTFAPTTATNADSRFRFSFL